MLIISLHCISDDCVIGFNGAFTYNFVPTAQIPTHKSVHVTEFYWHEKNGDWADKAIEFTLVHLFYFLFTIQLRLK